MKEKIRALLIDDDQGDFVFTKGLLSEITHPTIELDWVPTFEEGQDAIAQGGYDIYLVDYFLEDREVPPVAVPLPMLDLEPSVVPGVGAS